MATTVSPASTPPAAAAAPGPGWSGVCELHPGAPPSWSTISRCQSTSNQSMIASAMMPPTPSTCGELLAGRRADRVERAEVVCQGTGRDRADVADVERDQDAPERAWSWRVSRFSTSELARVRGHGLACPVSAALSFSLGGRRCAGMALRARTAPVAPRVGSPVSASRTTTSIGSRSSSGELEQPGLGRAAAAGSGRSGWVSAAAATSPSTSMSSAPREPMCSTRPRTWAGQLRAFGQRRSMSPSFAGAQRRAAFGAVRRA